jgi:hypothetical protein
LAFRTNRDLARFEIHILPLEREDLAWAASRLLGSLVFGITPTDPPTYVASIALLTACVPAACIFPIRRAMRFDPTKLLRA